MKKRTLRYFKHIGLTLLGLLIILIIAGLSIGASLHYDDDNRGLTVSNDGPYVFYKNDSIVSSNFIKGNRKNGFYLETNDYATSNPITHSSFVALDSTFIQFQIEAHPVVPAHTYQDDQPILAISDIEGGYQAFRDILIQSKVINQNLEWTFGKGHLVLVGDFVDRGLSVTQVLWFIYKLEQEATKVGGQVHYIIGNHEIKNMYGDHLAAENKYYNAATILNKQQVDLYGHNSVLGRWMASKNAVEKINGNLFVHGGLHPELADKTTDLLTINQLIRQNYHQRHYPRPEKNLEQFLSSNKTGPCWYRGYFKEDLSQDQIDHTLAEFDAKAVVVGHTLQNKVNRSYDGKIIGIDVHHPKDYQKYWPKGASEALLIDQNHYYRVLADGSKKRL